MERWSGMENLIEQFIDVEGLLNETSPKILLPHQFYYPYFSTVPDRVNNGKREKFLDSLSQKVKSEKEIMIYIHIPFCDSRCSFCSFDKAYNLNEIAGYVNRVIAEISFYSQFEYIKKNKVSAIHFGGGTPTILEAKYLQKILDSLYTNFSIAKNCIINIEGSATTLYDKNIINFIKANNISRVSVGVQTFDTKTREFYGSNASLSQVNRTLDALKSNDIITYIDIMYGYPIYNHEYSDYKRVISDIDTAIKSEVDGIEFGQLYPFYNRMEQVILNKKLKFSNKQQLLSTIKDSTDLMNENGFEQQTEYGFVHSRGDIILENAYYGYSGKSVDCLAIGASSFGSLRGWKYRNVFYETYMVTDRNRYLQIKRLNEYEKQMMGIIGFPKVLGISKNVLKGIDDVVFTKKLHRLFEKHMLMETPNSYVLTEKGKGYIDNIYMALLSDKERKEVIKTIKIHVIE